MHHTSLDRFLSTNPEGLAKGPVALIFVEDDIEVESTLRHHLECGFQSVLALMPDAFDLPPDLQEQVQRISFQCRPRLAVFDAINRIIAAAPGAWLYYCYNAEYLFYPFSESRTVGEMLTFHQQERRDAMLTYVIDIYADDLTVCPNAVSLDRAMLDKSSYFALSRPDPVNGGPCERQLDFFGGLRWRFEEHMPKNNRKIDRIGLFRARPDLQLLPNHTFNEQEYNTYSCPWHHNLTAAICSFRTAKALRSNPGSAFDARNFRWSNSVPFEWRSQQLLDLGLMEPGQWF